MKTALHTFLIIFQFFVATNTTAQQARPQRTTASGLRYEVIKEGEGMRPGTGDAVVFHYIGKLENGHEFDNSYSRGTPLEGQIKQMLPGMREGLQLMSPGAKYVLYIPSKLAYGSEGAGGGAVPPNANLVFEVELLSLKGEQKANNFETTTTPANSAEDFKTFLQRGMASLKSQDYAAALKDGELAVAMSPNNSNARTLRGLARGKLNDFKGALEDYNEVITKNGDKAGTVYFWRGQMHESLKDYPAALADHEKMLLLKPEFSDASTALERTKTKQFTALLNAQLDGESKKVADFAAATKLDDNRPFMKAVKILNADLKAIMNQSKSIYSMPKQLSDAKDRLTIGMKELEAFNDPKWPVFKAAYENTMQKLSVHIK